jgi:hypothetical protein
MPSSVVSSDITDTPVDGLEIMEDDIEKANKAWSRSEAEEARKIIDRREEEASTRRQNHDSQSVENQTRVCGAEEGLDDLSLSQIQLLDPPDGVIAIHAQLRKFWKKYRTRFTSVWEGMEQVNRETLLYIVGSNGMPRFRGDENSGGTGESRGIARLCPELNVRELSHPNTGVPKYIQDIVTADLYDIYNQDAQFVRPLYTSGTMTTRVYEKDSYCMLGERPEVMTITDIAPAAVRAQFENDVAMNMAYEGPVWELMAQKEFFLFMALLQVVDEIKTEVFGRKTVMLRGRMMKCANCHEPSQKGKNKLSACAKCRVVFYCHRECQKKHWKTHKKHCCK